VSAAATDDKLRRVAVPSSGKRALMCWAIMAGILAGLL